MGEEISKEIAVDGVDVRELYGAQNVYLEQIRALHPALKIVARGSSLKVLGSEAETQRFGRHMEGLVAYYLKYGHISSEVIAQAFAGGIAGICLGGGNDFAVAGFQVELNAAVFGFLHNKLAHVTDLLKEVSWYFYVTLFWVGMQANERNSPGKGFLLGRIVVK